MAQQLPAVTLQVALLADRLGSRGDPHDQVLPVRSVAQRPLPAPAPGGAVVGAAGEALQVAQGVLAEQDHVSSTSAVPPVGAPAGDVRFAAEARTSVSSRARLDVDACAIVEHRERGQPALWRFGP